METQSANSDSSPQSVKAAPPVKSLRTQFIEEARRLIAARYPLVAIPTFEDQRCENTLRELSKTIFQQPLKVYTWTITNGLTFENSPRFF